LVINSLDLIVGSPVNSRASGSGIIVFNVLYARTLRLGIHCPVFVHRITKHSRHDLSLVWDRLIRWHVVPFLRLFVISPSS
jgi:hypothetical protein